MRLTTPILLLIVTGAVCAQRLDQAAVQRYEARATVVSGTVTRNSGSEPWVLSSGERVAVQQIITTGRDGYAHFVVAGESSFDVFANSRVVFRQNAASAGDLLDVIAGRVRIQLRPQAEQPQQRILTPSAWITAVQKSTVAVAIDEDGAMRIDVLEGEVRVQHRLLPRSEPTIVRAVDAILVREDQQISRRLDRGTLYRYGIKPLHDLWHAVTPNRPPRNFDPVDGNRFVTRLSFPKGRYNGDE
jgi:hypothetical protein